MRTVYINTPQQSLETPNSQLIDGKHLSWVVSTEHLWPYEKLDQWIERKRRYLLRSYRDREINVILIYDFSPITPPDGFAKNRDGRFKIRYALATI